MNFRKYRLAPAVWVCLALVAALVSVAVQAQKPAESKAADQAKSQATAPVVVKAPPQDAKCMECHDDLFEEPVIHVALEKGCTSCHGNLDASKRPHKVTGRIAKGLNSAESELCLGCHEKPKFKNKSTHEALEKGCSGCHEAHSSKHKKLLKTPTPELCYTCHDKKGFSGKGTHDAVKSGNCRSCHDSHASENAWLLKKPPAELCLECHDEIKEAPHVVAGFSRNGHPLGDEKRAKPVEDPLRAGKPFYCGSCHLPHKGEFPKLQRLDPKLAMGTCQKCHQM
jgi:predicted CXXCH cytochrome family protein